MGICISAVRELLFLYNEYSTVQPYQANARSSHQTQLNQLKIMKTSMSHTNT